MFWSAEAPRAWSCKGFPLLRERLSRSGSDSHCLFRFGTLLGVVLALRSPGCSPGCKGPLIVLALGVIIARHGPWSCSRPDFRRCPPSAAGRSRRDRPKFKRDAPLPQRLPGVLGWSRPCRGLILVVLAQAERPATW